MAAAGAEDMPSLSAEEYDFESDTESSSEVDDVVQDDGGEQLIDAVSFDELRNRSVPVPSNFELVSSPTAAAPTETRVSFDCDAVEVIDSVPNMVRVLTAGTFTLYGAPKRIAMKKSKVVVPYVNLQEQDRSDEFVDAAESVASSTSTLGHEPVPASQLIAAKIGELHWDFAANVGVWLCLGIPPSDRRASRFWLKSEDEGYFEAVREGIRAVCDDPSLRFLHSAVDHLSVGFDQGPNSVIPVRALLEVLMRAEFFRLKLVYVRALGM